MSDPKYLDEAFDEVCRDLLKTFIKKNKDYGKRNILDTGELGIIFRINDKINRLKHLGSNNKAPQNESTYETWLDIAVYAVIAIILENGQFQKLKLSKKAKSSK